MKFNPKNLKSFFNFIRQSPIDDMAVNAVKNNADDIAMGALDAVNDIPTSISFDDIADTYRWRQTHDISKPPITPAEFKKQFNAELPARQETRDLLKLFPEMGNTAASEADLNALDFTGAGLSEILKMDNTPDYDALNINPKRFGQSDDPLDFLLYPDGFENPDDFVRYHDNLEQGFISSDKPAYTYPIKLGGVQNRYYSPTRTRRTLNELQPEFDPYTDNRESPALIDMYMRLLNSKS